MIPAFRPAPRDSGQVGGEGWRGKRGRDVADLIVEGRVGDVTSLGFLHQASRVELGVPSPLLEGWRSVTEGARSVWRNNRPLSGVGAAACCCQGRWPLLIEEIGDGSCQLFGAHEC